MRIIPAFLIAPIPAVVVATIVALVRNPQMGSDWRIPFFPMIAVAALWVAQLVIGIPIVLAMRRRSWSGAGSYAVGGAVMAIIAGSPFWIRLLSVFESEAQLIHRFMPGMAIEFLWSIALIALYGALTGVTFHWLTRNRHRLDDELDELRQRFE